MMIVFTIFSFLISNYFSSMIQTDMVVQKRPETVSTYQELLSRQPHMVPLWLRNLDDHVEFMNAAKDTNEGRIWQRAMDFGIDKCRVSSDIVNINKHSITMSAGKTVWLGPSYLISVMVTNACLLSRETGINADKNAWIKADPHAKEVLRGSMVNAHLSKAMQDMIHKKTMIAFERKLIEQAIKSLEYTMSVSGKPGFTGSKSVRDCVANTIIYPDHDGIQKPDLNYYRHLFRAFFVGLGLAVAAAAFEAAWHWSVLRTQA